MTLFSKYLIVGIAISFTILSCSKEQQDEIPGVSPVSPIGFDELEVGDEFNYILFTAESYSDQDNANFEYTGDTLNVEVCGFEDGKFIVSEKITEGSAMFQQENDYYYFLPDSVFTNYWQVRNDSLVITQKDDLFYSHLFHGFPQSLSLLEFQDNEVDMNGWKTTYPYHENYVEAYVNNGEVNGYLYPFLNALIDNEAMQGDGNGLTYLYNSDHGIVSSSTYSWWTSEGIGWVVE